MKTLTGWIVGVFGLGLLVGSFYGNSAADAEATPDTSLESVLRSAPLVDCGSGREAVLEPIMIDGRTSARFKCISTAPERSVQSVTRAPVVPAAPPVTAVATAPALARADRPAGESGAPVEPAEEAKASRSVKDSALIIGGAAGAGAGIGAIAKGKKGAALGAAIGGVAGTVYDLATRKKNR